MSRNTEYKFVPTNADEIVAFLIDKCEQLTGKTISPADPMRLFISWIAAVIIQERALENYIGNQNIPSRAEGQNLDALGELLYNAEREPAKASTCVVRFNISQAQSTSILIPSGTRVTDVSNTLVWHTVEDAYITIGNTYADVSVECETVGTVGNGYVVGQINTLIDIDNILYFSSCANIDESGGGSNESTDDEYYDLLRAAMDSYSCAGAKGAYVFFAKKVSSEIADVAVVSPSAGNVDIYVLMDDGTIAGTEVKNAVLASCSADDVRPLTDNVTVKDAQSSSYNITFTYYIKSSAVISSAEIEAKVQNAVNEYIAWQCGKFGRDINPDKLREFVIDENIKRIVLTAPSFTALSDGSGGATPQYASVGTIQITNGGYEGE